MADYLSTARQNFNTFGGSLASIQQNAEDEANVNSQNTNIYNQTITQLKLEGPQALVFGGMEAIRQTTDLYDRIKNATAKIKELPSTLMDIGERTATKLTGRAAQAKDLYDTAKTKLAGTLEDVQAHASSVANQAKGAFTDANLSLKDSANLDELKSNFSNFQNDLTTRLAKANDIIDSNVKQYSDLAEQAKSQIGDIQGKMDALKSSATGDLTGLAKEQFDSLSAKLPDLQGQVDKATSFIASANETRDLYAKQVSDQITQQGEKAKAQFADISSKLTPEQLQSQLGIPKPAAPAAPAAPLAAEVPAVVRPDVLPSTSPFVPSLPRDVPSSFSRDIAPSFPRSVAPSLSDIQSVVPRLSAPIPIPEVANEILPTVSETGGGFFSRIGDLFRTKTTNTLQAASMESEFDRDPEALDFGRGFITNTNEQIARFVSPTARVSAPAVAPPAAAAAAPERELDVFSSRNTFTTDAAGNRIDTATGRYVTPSGRLAPPPPSAPVVPDVPAAPAASVVPEVPSMPSIPEVPAAATSALEDLGSIGSTVLGAAGNAAGIFGGVQAAMDINRGQFNANDAANSFFGLEAGKSLGESALSGFKSASASLGEQLSGATDAAGNLLSSVQGSANKVVTSLSESAAKGTQVVQTAITDTQNLVGGALKTGAETAAAGLDVAKGAASDFLGGVAEAGAAVIPVVGEVAGIALAGYQIYEGFKDLFTHPSAPAAVAVPTVANISQGFQSGI